MGLKPQVTAITFVALGTSLPDLFASMGAARGDKYADNSIGNVTGSNSVNVFLGLGLAWLISAIYWDPSVGVGATDEWKKRYPDIWQRQLDAGETPGGFVVYAGDLGFSVMIFTIFAIVACAAARTGPRRAAPGRAGPQGRKAAGRMCPCTRGARAHHPWISPRAQANRDPAAPTRRAGRQPSSRVGQRGTLHRSLGAPHSYQHAPRRTPHAARRTPHAPCPTPHAPRPSTGGPRC